eukprot:1061-Prymnesium_polylepis.1
MLCTRLCFICRPGRKLERRLGRARLDGPDLRRDRCGSFSSWAATQSSRSQPLSASMFARGLAVANGRQCTAECCGACGMRSGSADEKGMRMSLGQEPSRCLAGL